MAVGVEASRHRVTAPAVRVAARSATREFPRPPARRGAGHAALPPWRRRAGRADAGEGLVGDAARPARGLAPPVKTAVSLCLNSRFPILLWLGPELRIVYNDAYVPFLGPAKHPAMLGAPGREAWGEIWPTIGPMLDEALAGRATWVEDFRMSIRPVIETTIAKGLRPRPHGRVRHQGPLEE